jgi:small nuclear ribonucleoprotein (snRNP)-like protein
VKKGGLNMGNEYIQKRVIIVLENEREIYGYIDDYDISLDAFLIYDIENNEFVFISRKIIKSIEVVE